MSRFSRVAGDEAVLSAAMGLSVPATVTPIKQLVVLFQENVSFGHYFGTTEHR